METQYTLQVVYYNQFIGDVCTHYQVDYYDLNMAIKDAKEWKILGYDVVIWVGNVIVYSNWEK